MEEEEIERRLRKGAHGRLSISSSVWPTERTGPARRLRVALVVGQFPAISETFVLNHATGLLDRGLEVGIFALTARQQAVVHADVDTYDLLERTRYGEPPPDSAWQRRLSLAQLLGRGLVQATMNGGSVSTILQHGRADARMALRFRGLAGSEAGEFDIIHCHFGPYGRRALALRNLGLLTGRLVTTFHGYDMSRVVAEEGEDVYDRLFREGDLFLPISDHWRCKLIAMGCPPERTVVHRMGVDVNAFRFDADRSAPSDGRARLLTVARLTEKKGLEYAIRAVARLCREGLNVEYRIAGDGPLRSSLDRLIDDLGVRRSVRLLGAVDTEGVASLMAEAQVLLAPSVTARDGNQEGLPVVIMEALASGLPVVSSHHTGIPELVEHGVTGLLVEERDVEGLAVEVRRLLEDAELRRRLATAGRARVLAEHDVETLNDRLAELYRELVRQPEPAIATP